jgi:hypothetical protein
MGEESAADRHLSSIGEAEVLVQGVQAGVLAA